MKHGRTKREREPIISLINIVFLILIFFMVAGTLSGPRSSGLEFVQTQSLDCCVDPNGLTISADARLSYLGENIETVDRFLALREAETDEAIRLLPDRNLPANDLLRIIAELKATGDESIIVLTEHQGQ